MLFLLFFLLGFSHHLGSSECLWISLVCMPITSSAFNCTLSISLLQESFDLSVSPPPSLCWYWCICHSPQHMSFFPSLDMSIFFVTCATLLILSHVRISLYLQFPFLAFLLPTYLRHTPMSPLQNWENRDNLAWQLFSGMKRWTVLGQYVLLANRWHTRSLTAFRWNCIDLAVTMAVPFPEWSTITAAVAAWAVQVRILVVVWLIACACLGL